MGRVWQRVEEAGGQIALRGGKEGREVEQVEATVLMMKPAHHYQASLFFFLLAFLRSRRLTLVSSAAFLSLRSVVEEVFAVSVCRDQQRVENTPRKLKLDFILVREQTCNSSHSNNRPCNQCYHVRLMNIKIKCVIA